jgi:hypothetical protein
MEMTERGKSSNECAKHRLPRRQLVLLLVVVLLIENTLNRSTRIRTAVENERAAGVKRAVRKQHRCAWRPSRAGTGNHIGGGEVES